MNAYIRTHPAQVARALQFTASFVAAQASAMYMMNLVEQLSFSHALIALAYSGWFALMTVLLVNIKDGHEEYNSAVAVLFLASALGCSALTIATDIAGPLFSCIGAIVGGLLAKLFTRPLWRKR